MMDAEGPHLAEGDGATMWRRGCHRLMVPACLRRRLAHAHRAPGAGKFIRCATVAQRGLLRNGSKKPAIATIGAFGRRRSRSFSYSRSPPRPDRLRTAPHAATTAAPRLSPYSLNACLPQNLTTGSRRRTHAQRVTSDCLAALRSSPSLQPNTSFRRCANSRYAASYTESWYADARSDNRENASEAASWSMRSGSPRSHPRPARRSASVSFRRRTRTVSALATSSGQSAGTSRVAPSAMASNIAAVSAVA